MKGLLEIGVIIDNPLDEFSTAVYTHGAFLSIDKTGESYIGIKNGDKLEKIRLEGANKELIIRSYEESTERAERTKKLNDIHNDIIKAYKKDRDDIFKLEQANNMIEKGLAKIIDEMAKFRGELSSIKETIVQKQESCLKEDKSSGFISEDALVEIIKKVTT